MVSCNPSPEQQARVDQIAANTEHGPKGSCEDIQLVGSQSYFDDGFAIQVGEMQFPAPVKLRIPEKIKATVGSSGMEDAFFFYLDEQTQQSVACQYRPVKLDGDYHFVSCTGGPRLENPQGKRKKFPKQKGVITTRDIRLRVAGVDSATRLVPGEISLAAGEIQLKFVDDCNQTTFETCGTVEVTSTRTGSNANSETSTPLTLEEEQAFPIPASIEITSPNGAPEGNLVELLFKLIPKEVARCTYIATEDNAQAYAFEGCTSGPSKKPDPSLIADSVVVADFVDLEVLKDEFQDFPITAVWRVATSENDCVAILTPEQDDDGDGIPTATELADSLALGDSDVDNDGLQNWEDSDADGDTIPDGEEALSASSALQSSDLVHFGLAESTPAYLDNPDNCIPTPWFLDSDSDGYGDLSQFQDSCSQPIGYVDNAADCDDTSESIFPGAPEIACNGVDEDCNNVDEGCVPASCECVFQGEGDIITQLQAGHGFVANHGGGSLHNINDTSDFVFGTQSAWIETDGNGTPKTLKRIGLPAMDFSNHMPRIWIKLEGVANVQSLQLYLGSNNFANQYKFRFDSTQGQQWTTEGDWVGFSISWSRNRLGVVGNPNRANITDVQFRIIDKGLGGKVRLHVNQLSLVPEPIAYPNGVLSFTFDDGFDSQYTVAKPTLKAAGYPGTAYLIIERLGQTNYMTESQIQDLAADGWEIAYHSFAAHTHTASFTGMPSDQLYADMVLGRQWLYSQGYAGYNHGAYPKGSFTGSSTDVLGITGTHFCGFRTIHQRHREAYGPSHPLKLRVLYVTKVVPVSRILTAIDRAVLHKEWIILAFHEFKDPTIINGDYLPADFQAIVDHVATTPIAVKTVGELLQPGGPPTECCVASPEVCDGIDNDCNWLDDFGNPGVGEQEGDGDSDGVLSCEDCDDMDPNNFQGNSEICDGQDNDCDNLIDEGLSEDTDGDSHFSVGSCEQPADDCEDNNPDNFPGNTEICDGQDNDCDNLIDEQLVCSARSGLLWMSFRYNATLLGAGTVTDEDIVAYDPHSGAWSVVFDGSDVGLDLLEIDGFTALPSGDILLSFTEQTILPGLVDGPNGNEIDDSDIVRFTPSLLGETTAGTFTFYFDGSDVGLTTDDEDIDAIAFVAGQLVISTTGLVDVNGTMGSDEDLLRFHPQSFGANTAGTFDVFFDGSDVGMLQSDVDAATITPDEEILLSTINTFSSASVTAEDEDVCAFLPTALGLSTSGTFLLFLDLTTMGIPTSQDMGGLHLVTGNTDGDGDGHSSYTSSEGTRDDCDDSDGNNFPGNVELCDGTDNDCDGDIDEGLPCGGSELLWMSFRYNMTLPGVGTVKDEDIISYNPTTGAFALAFDGSDVGLAPLEIDGLAVLPSGELLLSFVQETSIPGLLDGPNGNIVDDSDIVLFRPTSLGSNTAGTFVFYFDGSDVDLTTDSEDIDSIAFTNGQLIISTTGFVEAMGTSGSDEDLLLFVPTNLGANTQGSFQLHFDGSDVGLVQGDVDATTVSSNGEIWFSTIGSFSSGGITGSDEDVLSFTPATLGTSTTGTFLLHLDLSSLGIPPSQDLGSLFLIE